LQGFACGKIAVASLQRLPLLPRRAVSHGSPGRCAKGVRSKRTRELQAARGSDDCDDDEGDHDDSENDDDNDDGDCDDNDDGDVSVLLPWYCHAMLLPCDCHVVAMLVMLLWLCHNGGAGDDGGDDRHAIVMLLPCDCQAIVMLLPCCCHVSHVIVVMPLPCYGRAVPCYGQVMARPCPLDMHRHSRTHNHAIAMPLP